MTTSDNAENCAMCTIPMVLHPKLSTESHIYYSYWLVQYEFLLLYVFAFLLFLCHFSTNQKE
jgi:hypothetical protein